jgi:two-component system, chemotaxis family, CheB/CheR fusion protein
MANQQVGDDAHLVVVGASAGGVEALSILVGSLKRDFPAPLVLAQHVDPTRTSFLPSILERRTSLPVLLVEKDLPLESGKVYLVPANRHVIIDKHTVKVGSDHIERPRPSVDLLLSSAAHSYGEGVIAVILTGTGSDGAAGAVDVKHAGGTVVIQNPKTAAYPFMPQALPPTAVDYVSDLEKIGPLLEDILSGDAFPAAAPVKEPDGLQDVLGFVSDQANIDFRAYKPGTVSRRIGRRMAVNRIRDLDEYRTYLTTHSEEVGELVRSLLIKVTEFFRDRDAFDYLRAEILPVLIDRARESSRQLRLWSAGCATGEEAYSFPMLVADMLGRWSGARTVHLQIHHRAARWEGCAPFGPEGRIDIYD